MFLEAIGVLRNIRNFVEDDDDGDGQKYKEDLNGKNGDFYIRLLSNFRSSVNQDSAISMVFVFGGSCFTF